jgi:hypothetical protein
MLSPKLLVGFTAETFCFTVTGMCAIDPAGPRTEFAGFIKVGKIRFLVNEKHIFSISSMRRLDESQVMFILL